LCQEKAHARCSSAAGVSAAACTVLEVLKQLAGPVQISLVTCGDMAQLGQPGAHRLKLPHWVAQGAVQASNRAKSKKTCGNE
jgi:hypothetical protein